MGWKFYTFADGDDSFVCVDSCCVRWLPHRTRYGPARQNLRTRQRLAGRAADKCAPGSHCAGRRYCGRRKQFAGSIPPAAAPGGDCAVLLCDGKSRVAHGKPEAVVRTVKRLRRHPSGKQLCDAFARRRQRRSRGRRRPERTGRPKDAGAAAAGNPRGSAAGIYDCALPPERSAGALRAPGRRSGFERACARRRGPAALPWRGLRHAL